MRCYSSDALTETMAPYLPIDGFDPEEWLADHRNIALEINGDFALFEYADKGVYTGHYFFKSRGKRAVERGRDLLHEAFMGGHGIKAIRGLSPLEKLGARWLNRQLGFKSYGVIQTSVGPCELVILTKQEYLERG